MPGQPTDDVAPTMTQAPPTQAPPEPPSGRRSAGAPDGPQPSGAPRRRPPRGWLLATLPVIGALLLGGALFAYDRLSASYTAEALIAVVPNDATTGLSLPITGIYVQVGESDAVLGAAAGELQAGQAEVRSSVTVTQPDQNAPLVQVSATTPDAQRSATWANTVADRLIAQAAPTPVPGYGLRLVAAAVAPAVETRPVTPAIVLAAAVVGALAGWVGAQRLVARGRRKEAAPR